MRKENGVSIDNLDRVLRAPTHRGGMLRGGGPLMEAPGSMVPGCRLVELNVLVEIEGEALEIQRQPVTPGLDIGLLERPKAQECGLTLVRGLLGEPTVFFRGENTGCEFEGGCVDRHVLSVHADLARERKRDRRVASGMGQIEVDTFASDQWFAMRSANHCGPGVEFSGEHALEKSVGRDVVPTIGVESKSSCAELFFGSEKTFQSRVDSGVVIRGLQTPNADWVAHHSEV